MFYFRLALRNLWRQKRRYSVIFASLAFSFAVLELIIGLSIGINHSLERKAARYFAGEVSVTGYSKYGIPAIDDQIKVAAAIRNAGIPLQALCRRTIYTNMDSTLFFNGTSARQRRLVGVDWQEERTTFEDLDFVSGGLDGMASSNGILVSTQVAEKTGLRAGDEVLLQISTIRGSINTAYLVVKGVYRESSFFGATAYLDIEELNRLWGLPLSAATDMGAMVAEGTNQDWAASRIHAALIAQELPVFPVMHGREEQSAFLATDWEGRQYAVMTLRAHLSQVSDLLDALQFITLFVLAVFLLVVAVGVANTYRMIVRERTKEIGTMRAMGMQRPGAQNLFIIEALVLGLAGSMAGMFIGLLFLTIISAVDLSNFGLLLMFLRQGHPVWYLPPLWLVGSLCVTLSACAFGAWGPARVAAKVLPVQAINDQV